MKYLEKLRKRKTNTTLVKTEYAATREGELAVFDTEEALMNYLNENPTMIGFQINTYTIKVKVKQFNNK